MSYERFMGARDLHGAPLCLAQPTHEVLANHKYCNWVTLISSNRETAFVA